MNNRLGKIQGYTGLNRRFRKVKMEITFCNMFNISHHKFPEARFSQNSIWTFWSPALYDPWIFKHGWNLVEKHRTWCSCQILWKGRDTKSKFVLILTLFACLWKGRAILWFKLRNHDKWQPVLRMFDNRFNNRSPHLRKDFEEKKFIFYFRSITKDGGSEYLRACTCIVSG